MKLSLGDVPIPWNVSVGSLSSNYMASGWDECACGCLLKPLFFDLTVIEGPFFYFAVNLYLSRSGCYEQSQILPDCTSGHFVLDLS